MIKIQRKSNISFASFFHLKDIMTVSSFGVKLMPLLRGIDGAKKKIEKRKSTFGDILRNHFDIKSSSRSCQLPVASCRPAHVRK